MKVVDRPGAEIGAPTRFYRMKWGQRITAFMTLGVGCLAFVLTVSGDQPPDIVRRVIYDLVVVGFVLVGVWMLLSSFWSKVTWSPESIEVRSLTETAEMPLDAIRGRRQYQTRNRYGNTVHFVLVPKSSGDPELEFTDKFSFDDNFKAWYSRLPDLNAAQKNSDFGLI